MHIRLLRILIVVTLLIFNFQSLTKADDIREFQIEGISIGDSLLKFVDKKTILSSRSYTYKDDKFYTLDIWSEKFQEYPVIQFHLEKNSRHFLNQTKGYFLLNYIILLF